MARDYGRSIAVYRTVFDTENNEYRTEYITGSNPFQTDKVSQDEKDAVFNGPDTACYVSFKINGEEIRLTHID